MKGKVLIEFTDKLTRKRFVIGSDYEGTNERCKYLSERGLIKINVVKEEIKKPEIKEEKPFKSKKK